MLEMDLCRSNDIIQTPNGKHVYPAYFNRLLDGVHGIQQYRFMQTERAKIRLSIQPTSSLDPRLQPALQDKIQRELDPQLSLEVVEVDKIERTSSGKHRFVINNMQGDRQ
jgi:phenylacetate-CoA ligase